MDKMRIVGGKSLRGTLEASGSKNAALPILIATLLSGGVCRLKRVPGLNDIDTTLKLLTKLGVTVKRSGVSGEAELQASQIVSCEAPYDLVRTMRASVLVLGPLLARMGEAKVSLPGGCAIGARPIGFHLDGLEKLGAKIELEQGYVIAKAKRLKGARVSFEFPSVGATENILMAAVLAQGESILENCAKEPEIVDLAKMLRAMGAEIIGEGTETIHVQGKSSLSGCEYEIMGDRIETGTYLSAAFATRGSVRVNGLQPEYLESVLMKFEQAGATIGRGEGWISLDSNGRPKATDFSTQPYPGFPTDMQAQFMAAMTIADGACMVTENIFENRFMHVSELLRLGADITVRGNIALVKGKSKLVGAPLMATDLRASASLIVAGLCAEGETTVSRIYHLDRGYEKMETKLQALGAEIERIKSD